MNFRIATFAAAAALLLAPAFAQAQEAVSAPHNLASTAPQGGNVLGGGASRLVGTGEEARIEYTGPVRAQAPVFSHIVGTGEDTRIIYSASPDRATALSEAEQGLRGQRG